MQLIAGVFNQQKPDLYPVIQPRPLLLMALLSPPLLMAQTETVKREASWLMENMQYCERASTNTGSTMEMAVNDEAPQISMDQILIKLVIEASTGGVAAGKLQKALEYSALMYRSLSVGLMKQVAERINAQQLKEKLQLLQNVWHYLKCHRLFSAYFGVENQLHNVDQKLINIFCNMRLSV